MDNTIKFYYLKGGLIMFSFENTCKTYSVDITTANHIYETAYDRLEAMAFEIATLEAVGTLSPDEADVRFLEAAGGFKDSIKSFFEKIKEAIEKLFKTIKNKIEDSIRTHNIKKAIDELSKKVHSIEKSDEILGKKIKVRPASEIYKLYKDYMNTLLTETKKLYNRSYASIQEFNEALDENNNVIDKKAHDLKMEINDKNAVEITFAYALKLTSKETENITKLEEMYKKEVEAVIQTLMSLAASDDDIIKINSIRHRVTSSNGMFNRGFWDIEDAWAYNVRQVFNTGNRFMNDIPVTNI